MRRADKIVRRAMALLGGMSLLQVAGAANGTVAITDGTVAEDPLVLPSEVKDRSPPGELPGSPETAAKTPRAISPISLA